MSQRRERRTYMQEFKQQMVDLLNSGKPRADIIREYELPPSSFDRGRAIARSNLVGGHAGVLAGIEGVNTHDSQSKTNEKGIS